MNALQDLFAVCSCPHTKTPDLRCANLRPKYHVVSSGICEFLLADFCLGFSLGKMWPPIDPYTPTSFLGHWKKNDQLHSWEILLKRWFGKNTVNCFPFQRSKFHIAKLVCEQSGLVGMFPKYSCPAEPFLIHCAFFGRNPCGSRRGRHFHFLKSLRREHKPKLLTSGQTKFVFFMLFTNKNHDIWRKRPCMEQLRIHCVIYCWGTKPIEWEQPFWIFLFDMHCNHRGTFRINQW